MSNRSPMLLLVAGGLFMPVGGGGGEAAEEKSPQSLPKLSLRGAGAGCEGGDIGLLGCAGFMSKKEPPLKAGLDVDEACRECPVGEVRPAKGDGLACCAGGDWLKDSELKASFIPPKDCAFDCGCWVGDVSGGDCMPPNAFILDCCC